MSELPMIVRRSLQWLTLAIALTAAAVTARAAETVHLYVGRTSGSDAFVAITTTADGRITGYVCDGTAAGVSIWGWFSGEILDGEAELVSTNGLVLKIDVEELEIEGTVTTRDGRVLPFNAEAAAGQAGLWRFQGVVQDAAYLGGWIVLPDGQQRGVLIKDGTTNTLATFGDGSVRIDGVTVTAQRLWTSIDPIDLPAR